VLLEYNLCGTGRDGGRKVMRDESRQVRKNERMKNLICHAEKFGFDPEGNRRY
jgi:hypothetical protein